MSDLFTDGAVKKLSLMMGHSCEEETRKRVAQPIAPVKTQRKTNHQFVCMNRRSARAIRLGVVAASHEYLSERMYPGQEDVMSRNLGSFVEHGVRVVIRLFPDEASDFAGGAGDQ